MDLMPKKLRYVNTILPPSTAFSQRIPRLRTNCGPKALQGLHVNAEGRDVTVKVHFREFQRPIGNIGYGPMADPHERFYDSIKSP